jgi:transcriptional regulator with XRE-family HTH domain
MNFEFGQAPNKVTIAVGDLIKKAREEAGLSQEELGEFIGRKRLSVSEMENGKIEFSALLLPYLSAALKKPISYFFPLRYFPNITEESLKPLEYEAIEYFREIWDDNLRRLGIQQLKVLSEFDPKEFIADNLIKISTIFEMDEEIIKRIEAHNKRKFD